MAKGHSSVRSSGVRKGGLMVLMLLVLAAIAQATPIVDFGSDLEVSSKATAQAAKVAPQGTVAAQKSGTETQNASVTGPSLCELTGTCRTTMTVPEPQSLVLVGSGLLSMAGILRRKLLR